MPPRLGDSLARFRTTDSLEVVLHLAKLGHDGDRICLASGLLDLRVLIAVSAGRININTRVPYLRPHEHIVLLLVTDGELALRLLIVLREGRQCLDGLAWQHRHAKLGISGGVFVAGLERISMAISEIPASKLTKTRVSLGRAPSVTFSALCISSPLPSKNLPQPGRRSARVRVAEEKDETHLRGTECPQ